VTQRHLEVDEYNPALQRWRMTRCIPLFDVDRVAIVGRTRVTMDCVRAVMRHGIPVTMLRWNGRLDGRFAPFRDSDACLRVGQYEALADSVWRVQASRKLIQAKILNCRRVLQKGRGADRLGGEEMQVVDQCIQRLKQYAQKASTVEQLDSLRGIEGIAAREYFQGLAQLFPASFPFQGRNRRPPRDAANALLSLTYTFVGNELYSAIAAAGLDPCLGVFHEPTEGRPSLALDLLEPLRAPLCDLFVLRLCNLNMLKPEDFEGNEQKGGVRLTKDAWKRYLLHYEERMTRPFKTSNAEPHTDFRRELREAALDWVGALRGYREPRPFRMR